MNKKKYYVSLLMGLLSMAAVMLGGCGKAGRESQMGSTASEEAEDITTANGNEQEDASEQTEGTGQSAGITFEARDLEGNTISEAVFTESKLTMVNVWATYCNPCLSEMPGLGELAGEYDADEFQIIGIISDVQEGADTDATEYASSLVTQTGAAYTHLLLNESLFRSMLSGVSAVPTTFFVDGKGEVLDTVVGAMDKESWKEKIDGLLEE